MMEAAFVDGALAIRGAGEPPERVELRGPRAGAHGSVAATDQGWRASVALRCARWGREELPLPSGEYELVLLRAGEETRAEIDLPLTQLGDLRAELHAGVLRVGPPMDPAYDSGEAQDALERRYATRPGGLENAVFFESFYGRNASCNPLAIDREIARRAPSVVRYWSVVDLSVAVPAGAVPVVEGSPEWWRARGAARLLVVNDWLRRRFARRPGQVVLQTWHGTPLKRLALHRPGFAPRRALAILRESRRWNVLLAQNPYAAGVLSSAYAFRRRPVWVEGYPRNDVLTTGDAAGVRAALGLSADERVLLYAPTWRDDREEIVDFLDLDRVAAAADATVLVRGHSRTLGPGSDTNGRRIKDVTSYPDVSELLLVADALITDYSSVMFDFTVTGRPVFFFVPDLAHFRGELRGFSFDLAERAPGPLTTTQDELEQALADPAGPEAYADTYAAWRARFNARDDGHATERVVARILDQGFIDR